MAPFDRSYTTFYWSAIVNIHVALSATVFELFDVEWYHDLEIWVRAHLRPFKLVPFESFGAVSYWLSIVTMVLSCIICEIEWDIGRKSWFFHTPSIPTGTTVTGASNVNVNSTPPLRWSPSEYCHPVWCRKTKNGGATRWWKKTFWG